MAKQRHNVAFVVGSVLGGAIGAAVALWKTPITGQDLRGKISGLGGSAQTSVSQVAASAAASVKSTSSSVGGGSRDASCKITHKTNVVLGYVERAMAPIVGVKLGHTANHGGSGTAGGTTTPADSTVTGSAPMNSTSGEPRSSGLGHAASTSELLTPAQIAETEVETTAVGNYTPFPAYRNQVTRSTSGSIDC